MGVGMSAIGGFTQGLAQGIKLRSDLDDAEARRNLAQEQNERERARAKREESLFGYTIKDLERKENQAKSADDALKELQSTLIGNEAPAAPAPAQAIAAPSTPGQPAPAGIAAPAAAAPAGTAAAPAASAPGAPAAPGSAPAGNPFVTPLAGKDLDALYDRQTKALQKYFYAKGEVKEAMAVPKMIQELRDFDWSNKVGAALSGMAGGAPGAREAFAKVYGVVNDGYDLDPKSGQFDPQKGFTGLVRINKETGERETFNLSPEQAMALANKYKNPAETIKFLIENRLKEREIGAREETARAHTMTGKAALQNAGTNAEIKRDTLETNRTTREANLAIKKSAEDSKTEGQAQKFFRNAFGVGEFAVKTKDEVSELMPDAQRAYAAARQKHQASVNQANAAASLWDLNERKLSPSFVATAMPLIAARVAKGVKPDGTDEDSGLPYYTINGKKVLVPKD